MLFVRRYLSNEYSRAFQKLPIMATAILSGSWGNGAVNEVSMQVSMMVRRQEEVGLTWATHGVNGGDTG